MIYKNLILHDRLWDRILSSWNKNRLPHAILLHGPKGSGKEGHAIEIAGLVNCEKPAKTGACGKCPGCKKIISFQHSNVHLITALPRKRSGLKKEDSVIKSLSPAEMENLRGQMEKKGRDPYSRIELEGANTILINSVRDLRREIYMSKMDYGWRVILIFDADKLCQPTPEAANALLKILEEPPEKTIFVLVTSNLSGMIDTIKSRCQQIFIPGLDPDQVQDYLLKMKVSETQARTISHVCGGNLNLAVQLIHSYDEVMSDLELFGKAVFSSRPEHWKKLSDRMGLIKRKSMQDLNNFIRTGIVLFRDLLVFEKTGRESDLVIQDYVQKYVNIQNRCPKADWSRCIKNLEDTNRFIQANGYLPLLVVNLLLDIHAAVKGEERIEFEMSDWTAG